MARAASAVTLVASLLALALVRLVRLRPQPRSAVCGKEVLP
jgi:hypothetical protein